MQTEPQPTLTATLDPQPTLNQLLAPNPSENALPATSNFGLRPSDLNQVPTIIDAKPLPATVQRHKSRPPLPNPPPEDCPRRRGRSQPRHFSQMVDVLCRLNR